MDKFIVSARKYRPQNFNTVVGQSHITTTLKNAIRNNQLAHAFLFCGPRGVGKTTCARILAKTINCQNQTPEGEACNTCNSCVSFDQGSSLNIHELDAASNNSVDDIRALVEQVRFAPQAGKYKVYIVDEVHMLSASAFNAFLKTLEEPPSYAIFILATTEKHKILPTILSRCQIFDFKRITSNDTVEHLEEIVGKESIQAEKAALQLIAQKSEGCMRDSLSILDKIVSFTNGEVTYQNTLEHLNILDHDYYFRLLEHMMSQDMAAALVLFDEINRKGFEGDLVLNGFAEFIRNILVCKDSRAAALLDVVEGMQAKYIAVAASTDAAYLVSALNILNETEINYKMARNKRLHIEMALIKLSFLKQAIDLSYDNATGSVVKKKRVAGPIAYKQRPVESVQIANTPPKASASLTVHTAVMPQQATSQPKVEAKLATAKPIEQPLVATVSAMPQTNGQKKNLLQSLREKYGDQYLIEEVKEAMPLDEVGLQTIWSSYTDGLKQQQKHALVTAFNLAKWHVDDESHFTVVVDSTIQQKFIEQEKRDVLELFWNHFNNRTIMFTVKVAEDAQLLVQPEVNLSSREKYEKMSEQYPLIKLLKEKLKLQIEYKP
jgi:DNA polymerase-3 subunit gamma/tau